MGLFGKRDDSKKRENSTYLACTALSSGYIRQALLNNRYLLKQAGKTQAKQFKEFKVLGIPLNQSYEYQLRTGKSESCHLTYLCFYANYWHISLADLIGRNMQQEEDLRRVKEEQQADRDSYMYPYDDINRINDEE